MSPIVNETELPGGIAWAKAVALPEDEALFDADPNTSVLYHTIRVHPTKITMYPYSYAGGGAAYLCRMAVKSRLPSSLKPLVSKTRKLNRLPKYVMLDRMPGYDSEQYKVYTPAGIRHQLPKELRRMSKEEIWLRWHLPPAIRVELEKHIAPTDFFAAVTGKYQDPAVVAELFRPPLFRGDSSGDIELQTVSPKTKCKKRVVTRTDPHAIQLKLL